MRRARWRARAHKVRSGFAEAVSGPWALADLAASKLLGRAAPSWPTENVAARVKRALLRLDPRLAAQAAPFFLLRTNEGRELLRRIGRGIGAAGAQLLAHLGRVVRAHQLAMQPFHDTRRRRRRHENAVPYDRLEAR